MNFSKKSGLSFESSVPQINLDFLSTVVLSIFIFSSFYSCSFKENSDYINPNHLEIPPRHIRIVWGEDPSQKAVISWTTLFKEGMNHTVYYDTISKAGLKESYQYRKMASLNGPITLKNEDRKWEVYPGFFHHAELEDLIPRTNYYFMVETDNNISQEYYFQTAPTLPKTFKLLWGGDSRMGSSKSNEAFTPHLDRQNMNQRIKVLMDEDPDILAFIHGADYTSTADWRHLYWWFEDHQTIVGQDRRLLPLIISRGNHDLDKGFEENFWLGKDIQYKGLDYYFHTKIGNTSIITLNSEISVTGKQMEWLNETLKDSRSKMKWVITNYHRPAYPAVKDPEQAAFKRIRENWVPIFEKHNIDLALESDGHILKRTVPIRGGKPDDHGIIYIGEGGLGVPQRVADSTRWYIQSPGFAMSAHNVHKLTFSEDSLFIQAFGMKGEVLDSFSVKPRSQK
jgi:acid phosphatase type 7